MSEWKVYNLGEIASVQTGPFGSQLHQSDYVEVGTPIITVEHLGENRILHKNLPRVNDEDKNRLKKYWLQEDDIVFSRVGSVDRRAYVKKDEDGWLFSGRCLRVRPSKKVDGKFLSYFFGMEDFKSKIRAVAVGATMPSLNTSIMKDIEVTMPKDLDTQKEIAQILTSLDDKIELNLQMNQTLEAMAQAIFKEWFVNFNFPGFDGELVDGLPKGWRVGKVKEIYKTISGGTPSRAKSEYYENGTINWVKSKELNGSFIFDTEEKITDDAVKHSSAKIIPRHSILLAMYGATVGEYAITSKETTCNQAICAVIENGAFPYTYFFEYFKINRNSIIGRASGSAQQNISQALIQQLEILIPNDDVVMNYHLVVESLFEKIESNMYDNQIFVQTRDTLIPKLMSGQLEIA
jgi:type I restriction enzyme S subunit